MPFDQAWWREYRHALAAFLVVALAGFAAGAGIAVHNNDSPPPQVPVGTARLGRAPAPPQPRPVTTVAPTRPPVQVTAPRRGPKTERSPRRRGHAGRPTASPTPSTTAPAPTGTPSPRPTKVPATQHPTDTAGPG